MSIGTEDWAKIREICAAASRSSMHFAMGTINEDGSPWVTPIGALILREEPGKAYFFEAFISQTSKNLEREPRMCALAVNSGLMFWVKALRGGRFPAPPGVRLIGRAGTRREATDEEKKVWFDKMKRARRTKGYKLLWSDIKYVRDLEIGSFDLIKAGAMTQDHL